MSSFEGLNAGHVQKCLIDFPANHDRVWTKRGEVVAHGKLLHDVSPLTGAGPNSTLSPRSFGGRRISKNCGARIRWATPRNDLKLFGGNFQ